MKIHEIFEQTIAPVPPGQGAPLPPTQPTVSAPPKQSPQAVNTATNVPGTKPTMVPPAQQMGAGVNQQQTMANLDKIAAQVIGLKQQLQNPVK